MTEPDKPALITAKITAGTISRYQAGLTDFDHHYRGTLYALTLHGLERKIRAYARREQKAIEYVNTLNQENNE